MPASRHLTVERTARYLTRGPEDADEVWIALHGYAQRAAELLDALGLLDDGQRRIVAPEALSRFYRRGTDGEVGASWMTSADRDCEIRDYLHYLDALHEHLDLAGAERLCVLGFSQGAATAARWAVRGAADPNRLVLWAGGLPPDVEAAAFRDLRLTLVAGEDDRYVTPERLQRETQRLDEAGVSYRLVRFEGGHHIADAPLQRLLGGETSA